MKLPLNRSLASALALLLGAVSISLGRAQSLEAGFANPPDDTKPWCYWYWISDNLSKEGITRDLEAMARLGIGEAFIGNIGLSDVPAGKIKVLTPEWWALVEHAVREGGRTGVNIGMFNCPGWSQSGGPWIKPSESMRYLATAEIRVNGPQKLVQKMPVPRTPFQDVAVLAFPVPPHDMGLTGANAPSVTCIPAVAGAEKLVDGSDATSMQFPEGVGRGKSPLVIELTLAAPFAVRSLQMISGDQPFSAQCELQAVAPDGTAVTVRRFKFDRSNMSAGVGFMPRGPVSVSFSATTASRFRLIITGLSGARQPALAEIRLSGAARLEAYVEKQLGKMHPTPLPMWDTYLWPTQAEPDDGALAVPTGAVRDLAGLLAPDGTLTWEVPVGEWIIQRIGMTPTGMKNSPASPEGQGLEVDKMNRTLAQRHFDAFIGEVLKRMPIGDRKAFKRVVADSYEMGSQNWTDGFDAQFRQCYGYDPRPWLPVLSGRLVGSADQSERFLWDMRRLVADRVATDYVGGLRDACRPHGLGLWLENYGHWGFPSEFLKYGGQSDRVGGEYWVTGDLGSIELRAASSCVNTYGGRYVSSEAFTGGPAFQNAPGALKTRGDWSFCEGVNHFVLHVYIHQPWEDKKPGVNAWFGTEFNRHNTWFEQSRAWVDYVRRCCWLLQQGHRVTDVAYFIGEDAPKMTGVRKPALPTGRDFDYINAEVIERRLGVKDGMLVLPHGVTYQVLVLPELDTMRPAVLRKIRDLVHAGATVLGPAPSRSPSLESFPQCDAEVRQLAADLWGGTDMRQPGERRVGLGRIIWGQSLEGVIASMNSPADFQSAQPLRFTHRRSRDADIYFIANPKAEALTATVALRAGDKSPEFWWPDSGWIEHPAVYEIADGLVRLPISLGPHGSVFVVFRSPAAPRGERVVTVSHGGREILDTKMVASPAASVVGEDNPNNFTFAAWVWPASATTLVRETNRGVVGLGDKRNDAIFPPHGDTFGSGGHAGSGLAVGTNGVCVFEHGANYFAPTLVHPAALGGWIHVAVVYRDGQPSLYLNGELARTGLRSEHVVHSGAAGGGHPQFRGKLGTFARFGRALGKVEVTELARTMARPDQTIAGPVIQLMRSEGRLSALAHQPGDFELLFADGKKLRFSIAKLPASRVVEGPWDVQFASGQSGPPRLTFDALTDWTKHSEPAIRHFSGRAIYRKTLELPVLTVGGRLLLDLGEVRDLATVRLNGRELGTLWMAPWQVDITSAAKPGANALEVEIVNVWNNRLVGDANLPVGQRHSFLLAPTVKANAPLLPAGLLGPVRVLHARISEVQ